MNTQRLIADSTAQMIRDARKNLGLTYKELAEKFKCNKWTVKDICLGKVYKPKKINIPEIKPELSYLYKGSTMTEEDLLALYTRRYW